MERVEADGRVYTSARVGRERLSANGGVLDGEVGSGYVIIREREITKSSVSPGVNISLKCAIAKSVVTGTVDVVKESKSPRSGVVVAGGVA